MNKAERDFERDWGDLSRYNSEISRGVVHTPEVDRMMARKQVAYQAWNDECMVQQGYHLIHVNDDGSRVWERVHRSWPERFLSFWRGF